MMGCCPPSGMRAIYFAWKYAQFTADGITTITLPIDSDTAYATVQSELPDRGKLTVTVKQPCTLHIRVPIWAPRNAVCVCCNNKSIPTHFGGSAMQYVVIRDAVPGDVITVQYPFVDLWQDVSITPYAQATQHYRYHWIGNTVKSVSPAGRYLPLYPTE